MDKFCYNLIFQSKKLLRKNFISFKKKNIKNIIKVIKMNQTQKKPNIIQISLSSSTNPTLNHSKTSPVQVKTYPKKTFNPFLKPHQTEISLYDSMENPQKKDSQNHYDEIIQNLERKFEGLLIENRQLTEEMNSLTLSDQSSIDLRNTEFVSLESLPLHKESQSVDFQNSGFILQKAIEEKAKVEASLIQTVNTLKNEKKRLKSELSLKKQKAFHLEHCLKTHNNKKVVEISLRNGNDEVSWKRRYYELQKTFDKRNKEFEEIEKSYQLKIKECYNEIERLRVKKQGEIVGASFNDVEKKLRNFDQKIMNIMEYIEELESRLNINSH